MADQTKPDQSIDDWDSLPFDPDADNWDDEPPPFPATDFPDKSAGADDGQQPAPAALPDDPFADIDPVDDIGLESLSFQPVSAASESLATADDLAVSPKTVDKAPEDLRIAPPIDDFEESPPVDIAPTALSRPALDADPDPRLYKSSTPAAALFSAEDEDDGSPDDFSTLLEAVDINEAFAGLDDGGSVQQEKDEFPNIVTAASDDAEAVIKKVELDIEGIFLDDVETEPEEPPADTADDEPWPEEEPAEEVPAAVEDYPAKKKIPRIKFLMVIGLASLGFMGILFGVYKIFFSGSAEVVPPDLVIDPSIPPREPVPGEITLEPFFINFPAGPSETIIEMTVILYYEDLPDRAEIERKLTAVRDVIYRVTQGKGAQIVTNGELQKVLRQELAEKSNLLFDANKITYVQIGQIRILQ